MTVRRINFILWTACGLVGACSLIALLSAFIIPVTIVRAEGSSDSPTQRPRAMPTTRFTQDFATVFARTFRQPLDGSTAATIAAAKSPDTASPAEVELDGTIGSGLAILKGPDGSQALAEVGDDVNGAVIVAIRPFEVDLRNANGSIITLRRPAEAEPGVLTPAIP